jgi:hypothetical protein
MAVRTPLPLRKWGDIYSLLDRARARGLRWRVRKYGITVPLGQELPDADSPDSWRGRDRLRIYGGVRLRSARCRIEDAWAHGFDHIAIASRRRDGRRSIDMKNNLVAACARRATFLMALQLTGAFKQAAPCRILQARLPAVVIGGG